MIVRNLLAVFPFMAVFAARGWGFLWERMTKPALRVVFMGVTSIVLLINAAWLVDAAYSIRHRGSEVFIRQFSTYAEDHAQTGFFASEKVWQEMQELNDALPSNIAHLNADDADMVALYASEGVAHPTEWPRNRPGLVTAIFGPWEVNFDYYPTWIGDDRILVMTLEQAQALEVRALQDDG